jgi:hypothetical protein
MSWPRPATPDVMRHIRHTVLRGLDGMPEDERAVLLDTLAAERVSSQ